MMLPMSSALTLRSGLPVLAALQTPEGADPGTLRGAGAGGASQSTGGGGPPSEGGAHQESPGEVEVNEMK